MKGKVVKELETSKEQVMKEYGEYRIRTQELIKNLEAEVKYFVGIGYIDDNRTKI